MKKIIFTVTPDKYNSITGLGVLRVSCNKCGLVDKVSFGTMSPSLLDFTNGVSASISTIESVVNVHMRRHHPDDEHITNIDVHYRT